MTTLIQSLEAAAKAFRAEYEGEPSHLYVERTAEDKSWHAVFTQAYNQDPLDSEMTRVSTREVAPSQIKQVEDGNAHDLALEIEWIWDEEWDV